MNVSDQDTDSVIDSVLSASRVLVAVAARSLSDIAEEVTLTQYRTLVVLASRGPQNMATLAEGVGVTPATATRMCDRLVKKKLVVRRAERGDRRQVRLVLSKTGLDLVTAVTIRRRKEIGRIIGPRAGTCR
jgi:DNA-binding MarR family transcriptional regulator